VFHKLPEACRCETHSSPTDALLLLASRCVHDCRLPFPLAPAGDVTRRCVRPPVLLCAVSPFLLHVRSPGLPPVWYACRPAWLTKVVPACSPVCGFCVCRDTQEAFDTFSGAWRRHGKWILRSRAVGPHRPCAYHVLCCRPTFVRLTPVLLYSLNTLLRLYHRGWWFRGP